MAGVYGKGHLGVGRCVLREWVVRGGGLDGYFGEQGLPVGIQECVDYLSRQFVPKWDSPNCEGELAAARTASLLAELVGVAVPFFFIRDFLNVETKDFFLLK